MAGGMVEVVQEIITRSKRAAVQEMMHHGGVYLASNGPEDAALANGALIDGEFVEFCLFDDDQTGFDDEEAGFA